ncbi:hypothetical protein AB7M17_003145 [Bradyrhizobium sp. USDA 377]
MGPGFRQDDGGGCGGRRRISLTFAPFAIFSNSDDANRSDETPVKPPGHGTTVYIFLK